MKMPHGDKAVVELEKITEYCLSRSHPRGRHKARVFFAALAITVEHAEELREALLRATREAEATEGYTDKFGVRYVIDFIWKHGGRSALVRRSWIIRTGETIPRFITCYLL